MDAEFDSRDEPGTVLEEGSLPPQTIIYMKLVSCTGRERCKVLSSKSRRWLGQEASIGQDASIRDVAEVGWKK